MKTISLFSLMDQNSKPGHLLRNFSFQIDTPFNQYIFVYAPFFKKLQVVQNRTFFHPLHFCKIYVCVQALLKSYYLLQHFLLHYIGGGAESGCCSVSYYTDSIQSISFYHSLFVKGIIVLLPSIMSKLYFGKFRSTIGRIKVQRKLQPADKKKQFFAN